MNISDEAVEVAAKALALKTYNKEFDAMDDYTQNFLRDSARLALEAAAPYMLARSIATVEELDALLDLSIILDDMSGPLVKSGGWWQGRSVDLRTNQVILPATVIHTPTRIGARRDQ